MDAGVHKLEEWDVLAVKGKGIYISGDEDPWLILSHKDLKRRGGELAEAYFESVRE